MWLFKMANKISQYFAAFEVAVKPIYVPMNWVIIGPGNGLAPNRRQAITWTNAELWTIWIKILEFSFEKNAF